MAIVAAERRVNRRETYPPTLGGPIAVAVRQLVATSATSLATGAVPGLTRREVEVLDLIAQGRNNTYIAGRLHLSPKTIRNHISNIFSKLHVADRSGAMVRAQEAGLGKRG